MGPELTSILTQNDPRIDLQIPSLRLVPRWPQMTSGPVSQIDPQNKALFDTFIDIQPSECERSKDWIRPPTCSQE